MALKRNRRLTIERKPDEAANGETREQSPSRLGMVQTAQAGGFKRKSVRGADSRCKPEVMQTGITGRYGRRRKLTAGRTGRSREDKFQVSWELIIGGTGQLGERRKPGFGNWFIRRTQNPTDAGSGSLWRKPKDA